MISSLAMALRLLPLGGAAVLLVVLWKRGLLLPYLFLCLYLAVSLIAGAILLTLPAESSRFLLIYTLAEFALWSFQYLVVIELVRKGFASYPGIRRLTTQVQVAALLITLAVIPLASMSQLSALHSVLSFERAVDIAGLIGLVLLAFVIWIVPIRLPTNTYCYLGGCFLILGSDSLFISLAGEMPNYQHAMNVASMLLDGAVKLFWAITLTNDGEKLITPEPVRLHPDRSRALAGQLDKLNEVLRRAQGM